jgi:phage major head subunit gpT-like protein
MRGSRLLIDDDKWGVFADMGSWLGRSAAETRELDAATVYNLAFDATNAPGPDGKALCATDHPLYKAGGVQANTPAVGEDLDIDSLQRALTAFRKMKSASGLKMRMRPNALVVSPDNEWNAAEMMEGKMRGDTANHTVNAFQFRQGLPSFEKWFVQEYFTDPDAWFILADLSEIEVRFYDREKPSPSHEIDFDTRSIKTAVWMRYAFGFSDYPGVYGSPGA